MLLSSLSCTFVPCHIHQIENDKSDDYWPFLYFDKKIRILRKSFLIKDYRLVHPSWQPSRSLRFLTFRTTFCWLKLWFIAEGFVSGIRQIVLQGSWWLWFSSRVRLQLRWFSRGNPKVFRQLQSCRFYCHERRLWISWGQMSELQLTFKDQPLIRAWEN